MILGRRALIVFLAMFLATGALLEVSAASRTLAENPPFGSREVSVAMADSTATENQLAAVGEKGSILDPSGPLPLLKADGVGAWTETNTVKDPTSTPTKRRWHAMAATPSGVLLFGGQNTNSELLDDFWLFNSATNTWGKLTFTTSTPTARWGHAMVATSSVVLLFGGWGSSGALEDTWLFNISTKSCSPVSKSPTPRTRYQHAMAVTPSGDVLLFGGYRNSAPLDDTWLFNISTKNWSPVSASPTPPARYQHAMATTPSGALRFGGYGGGGRCKNTWLFNGANSTWGQLSFTTSTPTARYSHALTTIPSGDVLLFGGWGSSRLDDTWLFNISTKSWSQVSVSPTPPARYQHAMAVTPSGNVLLFGGWGSSGYLNDTWLYGPTSVPTISVTSPTAGASWVVGENTSVTWTSTDVSGTCTVELSRNGGGAWETLTTTVPAQGTYAWTVTGLASADCLIRVTDGTTTGTSGSFTIAAHSETVDRIVITPASATLLAGTSTDYTLIAYDTFTNTWDVTSSATYSIDPGAGGTWTSTNRYTAGHDGQWTVTATYLSQSATTQLTVTATFHLHSPTGGEDLIRGHAYPITWTSTGVTGTTTLGLSRDNGATWETLTTTTATNGSFLWTVTTPRTSQALVRVTGSGQSDQSPAVFRLRDPQIDLLSPIGRELWAIGWERTITWTSTDLDSTTLTILLARNGVDFTETLAIGVEAGSGSWTWTVTGPGTINAKVRLEEADCRDSSLAFFTITATLFPYLGGTTTIATANPWLEISGGTGTGTLWVTPLDPQYTTDPDLNQFLRQTGNRSDLFFDIGQQGLSGILTVVLHYTPQLGEETFLLYRWNGTGCILVPGTLNTADHTFTFTIDADLLLGTPFALGGDPVAMPSLNPWALAVLTLSLLGIGSSWFLRRRHLT